MFRSKGRQFKITISNRTSIKTPQQALRACNHSRQRSWSSWFVVGQKTEGSAMHPRQRGGFLGPVGLLGDYFGWTFWSFFLGGRGGLLFWIGFGYGVVRLFGMVFMGFHWDLIGASSVSWFLFCLFHFMVVSASIVWLSISFHSWFGVWVGWIYAKHRVHTPKKAMVKKKQQQLPWYFLWNILVQYFSRVL